VTDSSSSDREVVVGFATLPHYDDRVMFGSEVGLRVRLVDAIASRLPPKHAKSCVLKICASWADDPNYGGGGAADGSSGGAAATTPDKGTKPTTKGLAAASHGGFGGGAAYPKTLIVQVVGFKCAGGADGDVLVGTQPNLHVQGKSVCLAAPKY
jgi:hypothetical protein